MSTIEQRRRRTPVGVLGDVLLWVASVGGAICILVVIAAIGFHITLIMFKTGSMEPTIPTGSLAVVHEIPASDIRVGDIVTVDRPGELPVTHRVTSVAGEGLARTITLRGDANPTDDAAPYRVEHVRVVWTWIPGWARVVVWFSHPLVLGALTVAATALVTWAFWPRDERMGRRGRRRADPRAAKAAVTSVSVLAVAAALVLGGAPPTAQAAESEEVVASRYLTLTSVRDPALLSSMTAGVPVAWQVGVDSSAPEPGIVHMGVAGVIVPAAGSYTLRVDACPQRWVAGACPAGSAAWLPTTDLTAAVVPTAAVGAHELGAIDSASTTWLLLTVTLTPAATTPTASLQLWAWGAGDSVAVGGGSLAATGPGAAGPLPPMLLGVAAIAGGLLIAALARLRREDGDA